MESSLLEIDSAFSFPHSGIEFYQYQMRTELEVPGNAIFTCFHLGTGGRVFDDNKRRSAF